MTDTNLLTIARHLAKAVVRDIVGDKEYLGKKIGTKGRGGDRTKYGDERVEKTISILLPKLLRRFKLPGALLISEERGFQFFGDSKNDDSIVLIVDPIDGSNNMRPHSTPRPFLGFSVAIGYWRDILSDGTLSALRVGLIQNIFYGEEYSAIRGRGAFLGSERLHASPITNLEKTVIGLSLDKQGDKFYNLLEAGAKNILASTHCQRRLGSTVLDLCRVATGDYDAHISLSGGVKMHDLAAAQLVLAEAGGTFDMFKDGTSFKMKPVVRMLCEGGEKAIKELSFTFLAAGNTSLLKKLANLCKL